MSPPLEQAHKLPLTPGELVGGKYRIEGVLGAGGMATVFSAWHEELEQRVALKVLHGSLGADPTTVKRFMREARNVARIQSEHVARIMDVGRHHDGQAYIVMEHLEGNDLAAALKARGPMPVRDVADYLVQACEVLAIAHSHGIIHRDLKPGNLFLTRRIDGTTCVKVLDFGIAKQGDASLVGELTTTTSLVGSPKYMAPEQMANASDVDARTDIYSLGVIAYRLLSGQLPFRGDNLVELAMNVASGRALPIRTHRPDVPPELEAVILRCIERERDLRWSDVGELARALAPFGSPSLEPLVRRILRITDTMRVNGIDEFRTSGEIPLFQADVPTLSNPTFSNTSAAPNVSATLPPPKAGARSRLPLVLGVVALLGVLGGLVAFQLTRSGGASAAAPGASSASAATKPAASASASTSATQAVLELEPTPEPPKGAAPSVAAPSVAAPSATAPSVTATAAATTTAKPKSTAAAGQKKDVWGWGE